MTADATIRADGPMGRWDEAKRLRFIKAWDSGVEMAALDERFGLGRGGANAMVQKLRKRGYAIAKRGAEGAS